VQAGTSSYIRLNFGAIPPNATVAKATLRLYVNAVAASGSFDVFQVRGGWSESGVTFNNAPELGISSTGNHPVTITAASLNQFVLVDITSLAQSWLNGSVPNNGVAIALTGMSGSFAFDSKESIGTAHQPELEVVLAGSAASPAASTPVTVADKQSNQVAVAGLSDPYIDNGTALQTGANFNIDGNGTAAIFNADSKYLLAGTPVLGGNGFLSFFVGPGAGQSNTGSQNTFSGASAGQANTTGNYNSFMGTYSGYSNTTGTLLTFLGMQSGYFNTTGNYNSFIGANSGYSNTTGSNNSFVGTGSGRSNTSGSLLTFLGMQSGFSNTTGNYNSFMGTYSVAVSASDGSLPNGLIILSAAVTSSNTVTVQLCATASVTPVANTYNVTTQ
jgi:hypothetical protein